MVLRYHLYGMLCAKPAGPADTKGARPLGYSRADSNTRSRICPGDSIVTRRRPTATLTICVAAIPLTKSPSPFPGHLCRAARPPCPCPIYAPDRRLARYRPSIHAIRFTRRDGRVEAQGKVSRWSVSRHSGGARLASTHRRWYRSPSTHLWYRSWGQRSALLWSTAQHAVRRWY
jgi:hypothetical protein